MDVNANLNNVECLVTKTHFGYDTVLNICTGTSRDIAWAFGDWAGAAALTLLGLLLAATAILIVGLLLTLFADGIRNF